MDSDSTRGDEGLVSAVFMFLLLFLCLQVHSEDKDHVRPQNWNHRHQLYKYGNIDYECKGLLFWYWIYTSDIYIGKCDHSQCWRLSAPSQNRIGWHLKFYDKWEATCICSKPPILPACGFWHVPRHFVFRILWLRAAACTGGDVISWRMKKGVRIPLM